MGYSFPAPGAVDNIHGLPGEPAFLSEHLAFSDAAGMGCQDITPGKQVEPAFGEVLQFKGETGIIARRVTRNGADQQELVPVCTHYNGRTRLLPPDPP